MIQQSHVWVFTQRKKTPLILKVIYTNVIATLFKTAKIQKQPECPLRDEWIKKMWYGYTMEYYSAIKK